MGFNCGIVGLPNVGKSTLFNALTATAAAEAANYPFCTIEPNVGRVGVPDPRLNILANLAQSQKIIPTTLEFVDIAGLVRGASKGEGLGNQFLGHIRSVDAIIHVLRCFEDENITHVEGGVDPIRDKEIIETELMLSDMESLEKRILSLGKKMRAKEADAGAMIEVAEKVLKLLEAGSPARTFIPGAEEKPLFAELQLLTAKPILYVCNVQESHAMGNEHTQKVAAMAKAENAKMVVISASIEAEIAQLPTEEQEEFLRSLGLQQKGLDRVIHEGYSLLGLLTFFTIGPKEARAWTVKKGATAPQAAGVIHTDFEKGFIRAEVIGFNDYVTYKGEQGAKEKGLMRLEGKEYIVKDGDVMHFRFQS
jgi:GTP-binding protein YchF